MPVGPIHNPCLARLPVPLKRPTSAPAEAVAGAEFISQLIAERDHLPPQRAHGSDAPGKFAFANPDRGHGILERAGFGEIKIIAHDELVGSGDIDAMLAVC